MSKLQSKSFRCDDLVFESYVLGIMEPVEHMQISRRQFLTTSGIAATCLAATRAMGSSFAGALGRSSGPQTPARHGGIRTRRSHPGLQWTTYGYNFPANKNIPESIWKENIDWFIREFRPFGYDTICTDGWIESSQKVNANGYIISLNDEWQHDWSYWIKYLRDRGMHLSIYYNPFWVTQSARMDRSITVAGRPDVAVADITHDWDYFTKDRLYWVDYTRDGAREYCQNYVRYFKALGASRLRIDFLGSFEMGYDETLGPVNQMRHGREAYIALLEWIDEAAGSDLEVSLVMPNMLDHGAAERVHGDSFRVDRDAYKGGWEWLSGGRHKWYPLWTQWISPFDGFAGWSDISGPGLIGMDGDFLISSSFANDDERRTAVTLFIMAGSPICVGDTHTMIGKTAWVFQNPEVIDLNRQGLVGKPVYNSGRQFSHMPEARDTERWIGQLPDSSWVVALFNRGDAPAHRAISFPRVLGLEKPVEVRDLWAHEDLGRLSGIETTIPAHGCLFLKLSLPDGARRYNAQVAGWQGGAMFDNVIPGHTACGYVCELAHRGASASFAVDGGDGGERRIKFRHFVGKGGTRTVELTVLSADGPARQVYRLAFSGASGQWTETETRMLLGPGRNILVVTGEHEDRRDLALDWIEVDHPGDE